MCVSIAGDWSSSNSSLTISRGSCRALGLACSPEPPLYRHALVPSGFRRQVRRLTRKHSSRLPLSETGIQLAVLHGAHSRFIRLFSPRTEHTARCEITLVLPGIRLTVAIPPDDPSLQLHYRAFLTTTSDSAPVLRLGTLAGSACLTGSLHIGVLTFRMEARVTVTPPPCRTPVSSGTPQPCPRRGTRSWRRQKMFRHVLSGSLPLVSVTHT